MQPHKFGHVQIPFKRIHLELTNVCDFSCAFCPKEFMTRPYGYMEAELAREVISQVGKHGLAEKITFHVMGEPTLHPHFFDLLEHADACRVAVGLVTNGAGLGGKVGRRLLDYSLHQIDVSLQTPDERSFALRRSRRLTFEEYRDGALNFFAAYHARSPHTIFKFRFLNTRFCPQGLKDKVGQAGVMATSPELRATFADWVRRPYDLMGLSGPRRLDRLTSHRWEVVEVLPRVYLETYLLGDWGHAFHPGPIRPAWGGYCFGMRDHFAILHNGDVTLCCLDYDGQTAIGNVKENTLEEILKGTRLGEIMAGFPRLKLVHPYCQFCLGSASYLSWVAKPVLSVAGLFLLKPLLHRQTRLFD